MKLAFFDTKPYDKPGFDEHIAGTDIEIKYFETRLGEDTVQLAKGFDGVCVFVNDTVNAKVVNELYDLGVRVVALRCAGFNNVDTKACFGKLHVFRVPAYSPYAVAEHAMALLLTVNRHTNKAYIRTRDFNFSLSGLTGFDLHGKTVGVIGTGKIGRIFAGICKGFGMRVLAYDKFPNPDSRLDYVELPELLRQAENDKLNLARYAYLLARLQPKRSSGSYALYNEFSKQMYAWACTGTDRLQLVTAIYLYVYMNRKAD